jgi:hypothetical protein
MDFSIIIAHRGDPMGLWATIASCESDLTRTKFKYEYRICSNGEEKESATIAQLIKALRDAGKIGFYEHHKEPLSPPTARQQATIGAQGRILAFFDNHCVLSKTYFERIAHDIDHYGMDEVHSTTIFFPGEISNYEYKLSLEKNFWTDSAKTLPEHEYKPYRVAMGGHGGFAVRRDVWEEVGGYWNGMVGYGGEEPYLDLKMALMGKSVWIDPLLLHYHYAGFRPYKRHFTDGYYRNMMMAANIIGGSGWLDKVYNSFTKQAKLKSDKTMFDLYMEAEEWSREHAAEIAAKRKYTLEEVLLQFKTQNVSH